MQEKLEKVFWQMQKLRFSSSKIRKLPVKEFYCFQLFVDFSTDSDSPPINLFKLAVRTRLHAGRAELIRTEIVPVFSASKLFSIRIILKLLCYVVIFGSFCYLTLFFDGFFGVVFLTLFFLRCFVDCFFTLFFDVVS
jgi:hypothetical protein